MATKRKPTPAQIAARERFAAMARSGAFKKKAKRNPIERYELRRLDKRNDLDSTYKTLTQAKSALDEIDRPAASFYVIDTETGKHYFSFQAETKFPHIEIRGTGMQKAYKRNPRASNPVASKRKANPVKRVALPYVVEAKRDIGGEMVNMGAIAAFPGRAQADDYAKALQSRHKSLKLTVKAK